MTKEASSFPSRLLRRYMNPKRIIAHKAKRHDIELRRGKIIHFCLDKRCNGELEIDFESFWKNNTSKYLCVYKCNKCGKLVNAVDLIKYMNQHEE